MELDLLQTSVWCPGHRPQIGATTWIASGITIEEMQIMLTMNVRMLGKQPTKTQTLDIGRHRIQLQHSID